MRTLTSLETISRLVDGRLEDPRRLLGPHVVDVDGRRAMSVRAFLPETAQAWIEAGHDAPRPMRKIHPSGLFEAICPLDDQAATPAPYHLQVVDDKGTRKTMHDPYAFSPLLSEFDLYLLGEGTHWQSYEKLGAQIRTVDGVRGVNFAVWAPNATSVSIVGDFNKWDERRHPMRKHIPSGVWELFVPGLADGTLYKYRVKNGGFVQEKCDPYGFGAECPPKTASKVIDLTKYQWQDADWMAKREKHNGLDAPMSYYEVHLGSWKRPGDNSSRWMTYREVAVELVKYVKEMGYTHIELMPVAEHPFSGSWGYQIVGYFAPTARYGSPEDFMFFVDLCHQNDIGVVLDWVPAHFPKDGHGLAYFDGTNLYEHSDPRKGEHRDWGTLIFNYGRHEVRNFLISNALFWFDKYHIDGLRVDAVASMIYLDYSREAGDWEPNCFGGRENLEALDFLRELNVQSHTQFPGTVTIAEESTAWPNVSRPTYIGGLGFSLKWNMGWMNDTRSYMKHESIHRKYHHDELTFSLIYAFTENFVLPLSHDEVVHGKGSLLDQVPGDLWQKFANMRLLYGYMWTHPGKKLTFMGGEFGQWTEWNYDTSLQWHLLQYESHQGLQRYVADLNKLLQHEPALHELDFDPHGFEWVDCHNWEESVLAFLRKGKNPDDFLLAACNFTPVPRQRHRIGVSKLGFYREVLNSDSSYYGGSNCGNGAGVRAETIPWHGRPYSIEVVLPPLGVLVFKPE